jgi:hypothetical protein
MRTASIGYLQVDGLLNGVFDESSSEKTPSSTSLITNHALKPSHQQIAGGFWVNVVFK